MTSFTPQKAYKLVFKNYPDVVDAEQMSEMLSINIKSAYKLLQNNEVKNFKIGRKYLIPKVNILEYLEIINRSN